MYYGVSNKTAIYNLDHVEFTPELNYFEKWTNGSEDTYYSLMHEYRSYTISVSIIYIIVIFSIKYFMKNKKAFELRMPLTIWSGFLAIFSIFGAARTVPEIFHILSQDGFHNSVCHPSYSQGATSLWTLLFIASKPVELGDTLFIVLRKQKLIFLHWYHHVTVLLYAWNCGETFYAPGRWFMVMNYTVHAFMYTYYTTRALRIRAPSWVNIFITSLQILQMVVGLLVNVIAYFKLDASPYCHVSPMMIYSGLVMYASYFVLFGNFFIQTYINKDNKKHSPASTPAEVINKNTLKQSPSIEFGEVLKSFADIERYGFLAKEKEN